MLVHGGTNVSAASLARRGSCASGFMGFKLNCIKVLLGVYKNIAPMA